MSTRKRIRTSGVGAPVAKALRVPVIFRHDNLATISQQYSDGTVVAKLPVGPYTYKMNIFNIQANEEITETIDSVSTVTTYMAAGKHYVKQAYMSRYIKRVKTVLDGTVQRDLDTETFIKLNGFMDYDRTSGFLVDSFGGPNLFNDEHAEDAYLLGTANMRQFEMHFDLSDHWQNNTMKLEIMSEYAKIAKNVGHLTTYQSFRRNYSAVGQHTLTEIPANVDIARLFIFGDDLRTAKLSIDNEVAFDNDYRQNYAVNAIYGRDLGSLGSCYLYDFWRESDASKGLQALRHAAQRKRNANIEFKFETGTADTELTIITEACGNFWNQA